MPHPFKNLTEANDAFAALTTQNDAVCADLVSAQSARDTFSADLATARASAAEAIAARDTALTQVTALTGERDTFKASAEKTEADFKAHKNAEPARINAEVQRITAAAGTPAPVGSDQGQAAADRSKLKGLSLAIAAHKESLAAAPRN